MTSRHIKDLIATIDADTALLDGTPAHPQVLALWEIAYQFAIQNEREDVPKLKHNPFGEKLDKPPSTSPETSDGQKRGNTPFEGFEPPVDDGLKYAETIEANHPTKTPEHMTWAAEAGRLLTENTELRNQIRRLEREIADQNQQVHVIQETPEETPQATTATTKIEHMWSKHALYSQQLCLRCGKSRRFAQGTPCGTADIPAGAG